MPTDVFNANGTWTAPSGIVGSVLVEAWGGGGGGGNENTGTAGGGGGGGGYSHVSITPSIGNYHVTVGAAGTAGGGDGGSSQVTDPSLAVIVSVNGGSAGQSGGAGGAGGTVGTGTGNTGGTGGNGTFSVPTGGGGGGSATSSGAGGNGTAGSSGGAGGTGAGNGGNGATGGAAAQTGSVPGGGGGGGGTTFTSGANGAHGRVQFTYTLSATATPVNGIQARDVEAPLPAPRPTVSAGPAPPPPPAPRHDWAPQAGYTQEIEPLLRAPQPRVHRGLLPAARHDVYKPAIVAPAIPAMADNPVFDAQQLVPPPAHFPHIEIATSTVLRGNPADEDVIALDQSWARPAMRRPITQPLPVVHGPPLTQQPMIADATLADVPPAVQAGRRLPLPTPAVAVVPPERLPLPEPPPAVARLTPWLHAYAPPVIVAPSPAAAGDEAPAQLRAGLTRHAPAAPVVSVSAAGDAIADQPAAVSAGYGVAARHALYIAPAIAALAEPMPEVLPAAVHRGRGVAALHQRPTMPVMAPAVEPLLAAPAPAVIGPGFHLAMNPVIRPITPAGLDDAGEWERATTGTVVPPVHPAPLAIRPPAAGEVLEDLAAVAAPVTRPTPGLHAPRLPFVALPGESPVPPVEVVPTVAVRPRARAVPRGVIGPVPELPAEPARAAIQRAPASLHAHAPPVIAPPAPDIESPLGDERSSVIWTVLQSYAPRPIVVPYEAPPLDRQAFALWIPLPVSTIPSQTPLPATFIEKTRFITFTEGLRTIVLVEPLRTLTFLGDDAMPPTTAILRPGEVKKLVYEFNQHPEIAAGDTLTGVPTVIGPTLVSSLLSPTPAAPVASNVTLLNAHQVQIEWSPPEGSGGAVWLTAAKCGTTAGLTLKCEGKLDISDTD